MILLAYWEKGVYLFLHKQSTFGAFCEIKCPCVNRLASVFVLFGKVDIVSFLFFVTLSTFEGQRTLTDTSFGSLSPLRRHFSLVWYGYLKKNSRFIGIYKSHCTQFKPPNLVSSPVFLCSPWTKDGGWTWLSRKDSLCHGNSHFVALQL